MPVVRYQIRNEYGLADPDLYGAADRDDPEALLEGVAMAGLVGVLRQLGDLAEFAAEIFHNLHEEVMATSARGHSLMLRVQQLEAEFPAIEKAFLTQTNHSHLTYNAGIELHPNIQIDQNLVTSGDMPRFILDSYEECRGPPRLFMLDKFDVAGAGACLKRYSDPSFFKTDFASSGNMEPEVHREKKTRKTKKKALRWRNVENSDSLTAADVNSMLQQMASEKAPQNAPAKRSKLKMRPLSSFHTATGRSYMEPVLERYSPEPNILSENTAICSSTKTEPVDCNESTLDVYDIVIDSSANNSLYIDRTQMQSPDKQNTTKEYTDEWRKHKINDSIIETLPADEKGILSRSFSNSEQDDTAENIKKITLHKLEQKEVLGYADNKTDGSSEVYVSDDVASELDSYMDALAIMDSEIETDNESKPKSKLGSSNVESHVMDSEVNGKQEDLQFQNSGPDSHSISSEAGKNNTLVEEGTFSPTNKDFARMLADRQLLQGEDASGFVYENSESCTSVALSANLDTGLGRDEDKSPGVLEGNTQIIEMESSESTSKDGDYTRSKNEEESPHHVTESISSLAHSPPPAGVEEAQSATTNPSAICLNSANTAEVSQQSDATLDEDLDAAELVNEISKSHADGTETTDLVGDLESAQVTVELSSRIEESIPQPEDSSNVFSDVSPMLSVTKEDEIPRTNFAYIPENEVSSESGIDCISVDLENIPSDDPTQIPEDIVLEIASLANQYSSSPSVERELVSLVEHESEDDPVKKTLLVDTEMELLKERSLVDALPCGLVAEEENIVSRNADLECSKSETVVGNTINVSENDLQTSNILRSEPVALCDTEEKQVVIDDTVSSELKASSSVLDMVHGTVEVFSDEFDEGPLSTGELHLTFDYVTSDSPVNILPTERKIVSHSLATKNTHEKDGIEEQDYVPLSSEEASISQTSLEERSLQDSDLHKHKVDKSESSLPIQDISMVLVAEKSAVLLDSQNEQNEVIPEARPHDLVTHTIITSSSETDTLVLNQFSQTKMSDHTEISLSPADGNEADKLLLNGEQHADVEPFPKRDHILSNMHEERAAVVSDRHLPDLEIIMEAASPNKLPVKADVNKSDTTEQNAIQSPDYPHPENLNYICEADQSCPNNDLSTCREDDVNVSLLESDAMGTEDNSRPSEELSIAAATGSDANCKSCENSKLAQESPPDPDFKLETGPSLEHFTTSDDCSDLFDKQMKQPVTETQLVGTEDNSRPSEELSIAAATLSDANCKSCEYSKLAQETALDPDFRLETGPSLEHFITSDGCSDLFDKQMKQSVTETQLVDVSNFVSDKSSIDRNANNASAAVSDKSPLDGNTNNGSVAEAYNALQSSSELSTRSVENINELDKSLSVASTSNSLLDSETSIPLQSNSELSVTSLESISNVSLPSISNLDMPTRKSESSGPWSDGMLFDSAIPAPNVMQCNLDAAPPLPPLPPLQWRMGKLRGVAPLAPTRVTVEPFAGSNPFSQLPFSEHPQGYSRSVVEGMEPMDSFAQVHNLKYNNSQHGSLIPAEVSSLASSETAPMAQGKKHDPAGGNVCNPSSTQAAYSAKNEQYFYPPGALQQQIMPVLGPYAPGKEFQQCASEIEGKQMHQNNASTPQISEKEPIHPSNPFLGASATEAAKYQYKYRVFGVEQMAHQSLPMPLPPVQDVMPPHGYFMPLGENLYNPYYITLPEVETEKPNGRPRSILNRPRDPLIEAVASHDKSTLRKVSEIVQAPTKPKEDDRNTLLDQIRKKSFNLKPAAVAKPNIKGPATNLKVAAILEKANAIRQACAGSDEDEDNWSDG